MCGSVNSGNKLATLVKKFATLLQETVDQKDASFAAATQTAQELSFLLEKIGELMAATRVPAGGEPQQLLSQMTAAFQIIVNQAETKLGKTLTFEEFTAFVKTAIDATPPEAAQIANLQGQLQAQNTEIAALKAQMSALQAQHDTLQNERDELSAEKDQLQTSLAALSGNPGRRSPPPP